MTVSMTTIIHYSLYYSYSKLLCCCVLLLYAAVVVIFYTLKTFSSLHDTLHHVTYGQVTIVHCSDISFIDSPIISVESLSKKWFRFAMGCSLRYLSRSTPISSFSDFKRVMCLCVCTCGCQLYFLYSLIIIL